MEPCLADQNLWTRRKYGTFMDIGYVLAAAALGKLTALVFEKPGKKSFQDVTW